MIKTVYKVELDINGARTDAKVDVRKNDNCRVLKISFTEEGKNYPLPDTCAAVFTAVKPDGNKIYNECEIEDGSVFFTLSPQCTAVSGIVEAQIRLYDGLGGQITSPVFKIFVYDTVYSDGDVAESSSEANALKELLDSSRSLNTELESKLANGYFNGRDGVGIADVYCLTDSSNPGNNIVVFKMTDGAEYSFSLKDGTDGAKGKDGESVMVDDVTLSAESGGVNTVTFSDGNVLEVRNGEKGADGEGSVWHNGTEITGTGANIFCPVANAGLGDYYLNTETGNAYHCAESNSFWNYIGTLKGQSGVYAGSGDMPEDCNVQIDPDGEVLTVESIAEEVSEIINAEDKTVFIPETTVNFADYGGEYTIESDLKFDSKKAYKVIWDGASYECNVATVDEDGVILSFIGSKSFLTGEDDGIPFAFLMYSDDTVIGVAPATLDEVGNPIVENKDITFSVFEITEKYARLPVCQFETVTADGEKIKVLKGVSFDYLTNPRTVQIDGVLYNTSYSAQDNSCIASCMYPKDVTDIYTEAITLVHGVIENESVWVYAYKTTGKISGTFVSSDAQ